MLFTMHRRFVARTLLLGCLLPPAIANCIEDPKPLAKASIADDTTPIDDDEMLEIELRRRALEAEMGIDSELVPNNSELVISIEELDQMKILPGKLGSLPLHPEYPVDNLPTAERINLGRHLYFDL